MSVQVHEGEAFGIVGESGSGKSTLSRILMALDQPTSGTAFYNGQRISGVPERRLGFLRRDVQMVLQDPMSSLNPRMRVADIIAEPMRALRLPGDHRARVAELMHSVGLPEEAVTRYPHQFSGGQRQASPSPAPSRRAEGHRRRRAGQRARRLGARADPQPAHRPGRAVQADPDPGLPRPVRGPVPLRPDRGDEPGPDRRDG
ncbi:ATP-binding cassette domain-containing protein [Micromonospora sp. BRA006-A]|nr:ATP-binding cassette domain-containing protein [Micromonospora sp. BRA006-A]